MKVLLVTSSYLPVAGGLQAAVGGLAQALHAMGHQVEVATARYPRRLAASERIDGIPVWRLWADRPDPAHFRSGRLDLWLLGIGAEIENRIRLQRILTRFAPEVVHAHFADGICTRLAPMRGSFPFRLLVTVHGDDVEGMRRRSRWAQRRQLGLLRGADVWTAPSRDLLQKTQALIPATAIPAFVVLNGVAVDRIRTAVPPPYPAPYLFAAGRLTRDKGFDDLLAAFGELTALFPLLHLVLAGGGEESGRLQHQARAAGLADRVCFLGQVAPAEVAGWMKGAALVVVPSRRESFGLVAHEALAAGTPVIGYAVGGLRDLCATPGVALVSDRTPGALAAAIARGLAHPPVVQASVATWAEVAANYVQHYQRASDRQPSAVRLDSRT